MTFPRIPKRIFQTWKRHADPAFADPMASWRDLNPDWEWQLFDDNEARAFVATHFADWLQLYDALPFAVLRADVWRYMVIFVEGGLYADADTVCAAPIASWAEGTALGASGKAADTTLLINMELPTSFCQWTFAAAPRHPAIGAVLAHIKHRLETKPLQAYPNVLDVLEYTGPLGFTTSLLVAEPTLRLLPGFYAAHGIGVLEEGMFGSEGHGGVVRGPRVVVEHLYHGSSPDGWITTINNSEGAPPVAPVAPVAPVVATLVLLVAAACLAAGLAALCLERSPHTLRRAAQHAADARI